MPDLKHIATEAGICGNFNGLPFQEFFDGALSKHFASAFDRYYSTKRDILRKKILSVNSRQTYILDARFALRTYDVV